jgi:hypothetical protein
MESREIFLEKVAYECEMLPYNGTKEFSGDGI